MTTNGLRPSHTHVLRSTATPLTRGGNRVRVTLANLGGKLSFEPQNLGANLAEFKLGDGDWAGLTAEPLFAADLVPVCAASLAKQLKKPSDLKPESLLRVAHAPDDWPRWLKAAGVTRLTPRGPQFEFYGQALQAASDGVGVAMGIRPYIDDDLAARRLVAPFTLSVPKGARWYLVYDRARAEEPGFAAFRAWLMRAAQASGNVARR